MHNNIELLHAYVHNVILLTLCAHYTTKDEQACSALTCPTPIFNPTSNHYSFCTHSQATPSTLSPPPLQSLNIHFTPPLLPLNPISPKALPTTITISPLPPTKGVPHSCLVAAASSGRPFTHLYPHHVTYRVHPGVVIKDVLFLQVQHV